MDWTPNEGELLEGSKGRYEILEHIATGGFTKVYRARAVASGETVCVKIPDPNSYNTEVDRFVAREKRVLRTFELLDELSNVVGFSEHFVEQGVDVLVTEYVDGPTLLEYPGEFDVEDALGLSRTLCEVFRSLHRFDIVYRDLKLKNIMIYRGGDPVVIDFNTTRTTSQCLSCGSFVDFEHCSEKFCWDCGGDFNSLVALESDRRGDFKAPEQKDADRPTGPWTDVFGLGKMLFYLIEGFVHPGVEIEPATGTRVPDWLAQIIERATAPNPEHRYRDAGALYAALKQRTVYPETEIAKIRDLETGGEYYIESGDTVGRSTANNNPDIPIPDATIGVSRNHIKFNFDRHRWVLEDVSTNGTVVERKETEYRTTGTSQATEKSENSASSPTTRRMLLPGDVIVPIGRKIDHRLRFEGPVYNLDSEEAKLE